MIRPTHRILLTTLCAIVAGCGGSSSSVAPATPAAATLVFEPATSLAITKGSIQHVSLALASAGATSGTTTRSVSVTTSNTAVADVFPGTCTLSTVSAQSQRCLLTVTGKADGTTTLLATADGIAPVQIPAAVSATTAYGQLAVESSGTYSSGPATLNFANNGVAPFSLRLKARMVGSSGVGAAQNVVISFAAPAGVTFNPAQCTVTTLAPDCTTVASLSQATATAITVSAAGSSYSGYTPVAVTANPAAPSTNGTIAISTQSGNNVPNGMKAPLFVNWTNAVAGDTVNLTLTLAGAGISFYSYAPGNNTTPTLSQTQTCTLVYVGAGAAGNVMNCGLGLVGAATSGTVTVSATATSTAGQTYTLGSLVLGAIAPAAAIRTVTFTNNSAETIYVGITGGAATAYLDAGAPPPGPPTTANMKPGAASQCGPSNPQAACPLGTTCMQGGASPNTDFTKTPYYCYYDAPTPSKGYAVAATDSTTISISASSISPNGVIWSGNFYPRSGCDLTTGICDNATCRGAAGGLVCGPGTGPSPGINTLAELTFQASPAPDFYDVSIINGANFATQFGPTNVSISSTNSYMCGTAGSTAAQNGGYSAGGIGLPAAPWTMTPNAQSFPSGAVTSGDASSYFRIVIPTTTPVTQCTQASDCTDPVSNTCGYAMSDVTKGAFTFATRSCGRPVAWASANAIWGANQTSGNVAPFSFGTNWPKGLASGGTVSVGDLQLCINQTYSSYVANGTAANPVQPAVLACGGVMWGATQSALPIANPVTNVGLGLTTPSTPAYTANANWLDYVLPTIRWMKNACPTCYTYPFDDMSSTFTCANSSASAATNYGVTFSDLK